MKPIIWSFVMIAIIFGAIWQFQMKNAYFTLEGSVDADIDSSEAKILPLGKSIVLNVSSGHFSIKLSKEEAENMEIVKFKFNSKRKGVIKYDLKANSYIGKMRLKCQDGEITVMEESVRYL